MKLKVITAVHGRKNITTSFLMAMNRIYYEFGVDTMIVVTDRDENIPQIQSFGFKYLEHNNKPVGKKFNAGVNSLRNEDFTHLMVLGSDDIVSSRFIEHALTLGEYDISGIDGLWFWGLNPRRAGFESFGFFPVSKVFAGPGKIISRKLVEACDYNIWPDECGYGMDAKMMYTLRDAILKNNISYKQKRYSLKDTGGFLMDVKYDHHISSMSPITRRECYDIQDPYEVIPKHLPEKEYGYLFDLHKTTAKAWYDLKKSVKG